MGESCKIYCNVILDAQLKNLIIRIFNLSGFILLIFVFNFRNVKNITKLSEKELEAGVSKLSQSWHNMYRDSAWIFIGGLAFDLTEGDIICVFSQYGEIVNVNLIRDKETGKSKGYCFLCYEDQRSTVLAVDNLNGIKLVGRTIRVDHVENYRIPKMNEDLDPVTKRLYEEGCAPKEISTLTNAACKEEDVKPVFNINISIKKHKDKKKHSKEKKHKRHRNRSSSSSSSTSSSSPPRKKHPKSKIRKDSKEHRDHSRSSGRKLDRDKKHIVKQERYSLEKDKFRQ